MNELGTRHNQGKPQWSLIPFKALEPMVYVLMYGAKKYSRENWKKGFKVTDIADSLLRHIYALLSGELCDRESGLPHIGHILANAMFISYMLMFRPDMNDLPEKEASSDDGDMEINIPPIPVRRYTVKGRVRSIRKGKIS